MFEGVTGSGSLGDIALDDITVSYGSCLTINDQGISICLSFCVCVCLSASVCLIVCLCVSVFKTNIIVHVIRFRATLRKEREDLHAGIGIGVKIYGDHSFIA